MQILVGVIGLILLIWFLFEKVRGAEPATLVLIVSAGVLAWAGMLVWIELGLREQRQTCPACKVRIR